MKVLAIDPGLSGAVALVGPGELKVRRDFLHGEHLVRAVAELAPAADVAVIELVASRPGQGIASMFNFGHAAGIAMGALLSANFSAFDPRRKPLIEIDPRKWQFYYRRLLGHPKKDPPVFDSAALVRRFHPLGAEFLGRQKDHNSADAILMGLWYVLTMPDTGSIRERDQKRLPQLKKTLSG